MSNANPTAALPELRQALRYSEFPAAAHVQNTVDALEAIREDLAEIEAKGSKAAAKLIDTIRGQLAPLDAMLLALTDLLDTEDALDRAEAEADHRDLAYQTAVR
jgi:hypothetical protein